MPVYNKSIADVYRVRQKVNPQSFLLFSQQLFGIVYLWFTKRHQQWKILSLTNLFSFLLICLSWLLTITVPH